MRDLFFSYLWSSYGFLFHSIVSRFFAILIEWDVVQPSIQPKRVFY